MQQLLDTPGFAAVVVSILGALATLIGALAVYVQVKTEQARQGERMVGLQRQINQLPAQPQAPVYLPAPAAPQAPPVATTVLTLPAEGTALHIEAVPRSTPAPAPAEAAAAPGDAATSPPPGHAPAWRP